jgi:anthraniloyl-CoA monooxygenase
VYEAAARPSVERIQASARPSLSWWERFGRYYEAFEPWQFSFHFFSRSISVDRLERRDPGYVAKIRSRWCEVNGGEPRTAPLAIGPTTVRGRVLEADTGHTEARTAVGDATISIPLVARSASVPRRPWGLRVDAPEHETAVPQVLARLRADVTALPDIVAVRGGSMIARAVLAEEVRLTTGFPVMLVEEHLTEAGAETLLLSGRADLVASSAASRTPRGPR